MKVARYDEINMHTFVLWLFWPQKRKNYEEIHQRKNVEEGRTTVLMIHKDILLSLVRTSWLCSKQNILESKEFLE